MTKREECVARVREAIREAMTIRLFGHVSVEATDATIEAASIAAFDAILSVLEEPDEEMIEAGEAHDSKGADYSGYAIIPADAETHWRAMLTSLNQHPRPEGDRP